MTKRALTASVMVDRFRGLSRYVRLPKGFERNDKNIILVISILFFLFVLIRTAWVCDDAYITFRTVDNFVNGYGLTWNPRERVQVYSHPLWMFLLSALYSFTSEIFYTSIFLSIVLSAAAILLLALRIASSLSSALLGITILTFSKAFTDYSTSGLENPLTHLILALFITFYLKSEASLKTLSSLSFIIAVGALNRMDTILLFLPTLVYVFWKLPKLKGMRVMTTSFLPFIIWELFSLLYYGFPFPNPSYAKFSTLGLSRSELAEQGFFYLLNSICVDPLTLLVITATITIPFLRREWVKLPIVAGIMLYILFVVNIGGCFMSGRYLTAPLFCAVSILSSVSIAPTANHYKFEWLFVFFVVVLVGLSSPYTPVRSDATYSNLLQDANGIADERGVYYQATGLLPNARRNVDILPNHPWSALGREARKRGSTVVVWGNIGFFGFHAGPDVHIVDGLSDPLLSRLPAVEDENWRVGHWRRIMPKGYIETLTSGENVIGDKNLAEYYDKICVITRGPLFNINRLIVIVNMNLGRYDYLIDREYYRTGYRTVVSVSEISQRKVERTPWNHPDNFLISNKGIVVNLERLYHAKQIEVSLDNNDDYQITYLNGGSEIAIQTVQARIVPGGGLVIHIIVVPKDAVERGYDSLKITPVRGDGAYSIGHIQLLE